MKGGRITENVVLAQKIIPDIRMRRKPTNVVIKLDMEKAYDKMDWMFLVKVLGKIGLDVGVVDKI